ncbi:MAG: cellulase family glycosylhydrolase [Ruminococcus sp.]|nr:cellulase family glycosylhydrolase [Ruminococcus sp.]
MKNFKQKAAAVLCSVTALLAAAAFVPARASLPASSISVSAAAPSASVTAPTLNSGYSSTKNTNTISWNKVSGADGYYIYRYADNCKIWLNVARVPGSQTSLLDTGLPPGTRFQYKVKAYKTVSGKNNFSNYSNTINTGTNPTTPIVFVCSGKTDNSISLTWSGVKGTGYELERSTNGTSWTTAATLTGMNTNTYTNTGLTAGTKYYFRLRATSQDDSGKKLYGDYTAVSSFKTTGTAPVTDTTPVGQHGRLSVKGANIVDKNGNVFKIKGMSTHGIMWETFGDILSKDSLKVLRDDWKVNTIRIAMYTAEWGGYTTGSTYASQAKTKVVNGVKNATDLGMYVIIDWHILSDGDPRTHQSEAVAFFSEMAQKYKGQENVIYEICNEPNGSVNWTTGIKSYCEAVVSAIRKYDKNAIIICGTGTWSQDIDKVVGNQLSDKNCVYALHFYANTHTDWLRTRLQNCYNKGLPVLVSEFGTCDASGNGGFNESQTKTWLTLLDKLNVGYINWSAANKSETASAFKAGTNLAKISAGESQLTDSGKLIRAWYRAH